MKCNLFFCDDAVESGKYFADGIDTILTNDYLAIEQVRKEVVNDKNK